MLTSQVIADDPWQLGWHREWFLPTVEQHAFAAFLEMHGLGAEASREIWERILAALMADIGWCMATIETLDFIGRAQAVARHLYLRRLRHLLVTSPDGGCA